MPKRYHVARKIDAPARRAWDLLANADSYAEWNASIVSLEGPIAEGGTIALVSTADPKRTFRLEVTEMTAPTRMVWSDGLPLGLFKGVRTFLLVERGGSTEFSMTEEFSGPLSGLITKAIPDMTESFNQFADGLKAAAEASSG
jgi:hypothetical protein